MATEKKNSRQELVESIINSMKSRDGEWQKTWTNLSGDNTPHNPITGTKYKGINLVALSLEQTKLNTVDSRWCTFDQAVEAGYKIPKNTKAAHAYFYDLNVSLDNGNELHRIKAKNLREYITNVIGYYREQYPDKAKEIRTALAKANGLQPAMNSDKGKLALFVGELNKATGAQIKLSANMVIRTFPIFNYSQLENVPALEIKQNENGFKPIHRAEGILLASGAKIYHNSANRNYYIPEKHEIHLTPKESFKSTEAYYSTALHEIAHWTKGDGLPRYVKIDEKSGNDHNLAYAREELRAELASIFMSSELNLKLDIQNHSAYLGSYLQILNNDYNEFFAAVSDAQKICNHVIGLEKRLDLENAEAKELQTKNPDLYHKIVEYNVKAATLEHTPIKSDSTYDFKVGDIFVAKSNDNELSKYQIDKISNDKLIVLDKTLAIVQEHTNKSFQQLLDNTHAEKLDVKSPQLFINPEYQNIGQEVLRNEFFGLAKQNLENTFIFNDARAAQRFIDKLINEHDVPGNMINSNNFTRQDKAQSFIITRDSLATSAVAAQEHPNKIYLERFFEEKNLPIQEFNIQHKGHNINIQSDLVISYLINNLTPAIQEKVRDTLVKIDFANGDVNHFLEHCAHGMVLQHEAEMKIFNEQSQDMEQTASNSNEKSIDPVENSVNDDNDFSI